MVEFWTAIITVVIASVIGPLATRIWDWIVGRKDTTLQDLDMRVRRMEILENIREHPEDEHTILDLFDQYEKKGRKFIYQDARATVAARIPTGRRTATPQEIRALTTGADMDKKQFKDLYRKSIKIETVYCCICGKPILKASDLTVEHVQPLSRGGANDKSNWGASHAKCNHKKGALTMDEYRLWLELERKRNGVKQK